MVHDSGREERAREAGERARKGSRVSTRVNALPSRGVVKYVAIYTGDWRHWRLGSKRVRPFPTPAFSPFLALSPGLPNSRPYMIVSSSNPCANRSDLPDQKKAFGKSWYLPEWCKIETVWDSSPHFSLYPLNLSIVIFSLFFTPYSIDDIWFLEKIDSSFVLQKRSSRNIRQFNMVIRCFFLQF